MKIDILQMELDKKLPHWLSPEARIDNARRRQIMDKHRQRAALQKRLQFLKQRLSTIR